MSPVAAAAAPGPLPDCGTDHAGRRGGLDETARRVSHQELVVAELLVSEGHHVRSLPEMRGAGPVADFEVCGIPVEVKTLVPRRERPGGRPANERSVYNALLRGAAQAGTVVVGSEGSGLSAADAAAGVCRFAESGRSGQVRAVRIFGDGFDLAWSVRTGLEVTPRLPPGAPAGRPGPGGVATPPVRPATPTAGPETPRRRRPAKEPPRSRTPRTTTSRAGRQGRDGLGLA